MIVRERDTFADLINCLTGDAKAPRNWHAVVDLATRTLTVGTLADRVLSRRDYAMPEELRELLVDLRDRARRRNEHIIRQFAELLPALNGVGVTPIAMKGLARLLSSPDEGSRLLSDIDILVPAQRRIDCVEALRSLGYEIIVGAENELLPPVLARTRDVGTVDLHTSLKPHYLNLGYDQIKPYCSTNQSLGGEVRVPDATCQLFLNVLHDQLNDKDYWCGQIDVRHLVDMHRLIAEEGVQWSRLESFTKDSTLRRAFKVQMLTAGYFLQSPIPERYRNGLWTRVQLLRRRIQSRLPSTRPIFTAVTMALDPPRESGQLGEAGAREPKGGLQKFGNRARKYFWVSYPGKLH